MDPASEEITQILAHFAHGQESARDRLLPLVYGELKRIAAAHMRRERPDNSLQPTALVHEAYLKLIGIRKIEWQNRAHFYAMASRLMREILIDKARRDDAEKRGRGVTMIALDDALARTPARDVNLLALDRALDELATQHERKAKIVEMRFFGGLTEEEIACVLGISVRTVKREWQFTRAWLFSALSR